MNAAGATNESVQLMAVELPHFTVYVEQPGDSKLIHSFHARAEEPELTLSHVMNLITFDQDQGDKFDANFISFLNEETNEVDYYV